MDGIIRKVRFVEKKKLNRHLRKCPPGRLKMHYLVIVNLLNHRSARQTAQALVVSVSTVYRIAREFNKAGEAGLLDRREDNGHQKLDEEYLSVLHEVVQSCPHEYGHRRPTWTRELLVETMRKKTGIRVHVTTMSRALEMIKARRGRPRPVVCSWWSKQAKTRRINNIRSLIRTLPKGHVAVYEDEVDIHLNPKIGWDWMVRGRQKEVVTPGKNIKRYLAGALDAVTGKLIWAESEHKNSDLFISLIRKLNEQYPKAKVIHVILDNYRIHTSRITQMSLKGFGRKILLHFLPPYCPNENKIERLWKDLHDQVTRNHRCADIKTLMNEVRLWLRKRKRRILQHYLKKVA